MSVFIFALGIKAANGLVKSTINTANTFAERGINVCIVNILGKNGGFDFLDSAFDLDEKISRISLDVMSEYLSEDIDKKIDFYVENQQFLKANYHNGHKKSLQYLNQKLTENDLVIFSHPLALVLFSEANPCTKATTIIQVHGNYTEEINNLNLLKSYIDYVDYVQTVSLYMKDDMKDILDIPENKIKCIYNITKPIEISKKSDGITKRISIIGSIQKRKNQLDAIHMLHLIKDRNVVLQIFGKPLEQDYMDLLKGYIDLYGLRDRVIFQGVADERYIYENTDIAIMTSKHEGFGYIFLESSLYNIPVVAYDFKYGAREFTCDNKNGCLIKMGDYPKMAQVVSNILNNNQIYREVVEFNSHNFHDKYNEDKIFNAYCELFHNINNNVDFDFQKKTFKPSIEVEDLKCTTIKLPIQYPWQDSFTEEEYFRIDFRSNIDDKSKVNFFYTYKKSRFPLNAVINKENSVKFFASRESLRNMGSTISFNVPKKNRLALNGQMDIFSLGVEIDKKTYMFANIINGKPEKFASEKNLISSTSNIFGFCKIKDIPHIMRPDGLYIRYPSFESIKSIKNETGESFKFTTHVFRFYGQDNLFFKVNQGLYKELNILTNSKKMLTLDFSEYSYKSVFNKIIGLEKKYSLYDIRISNIFAWELIRAPLFEHILEAFGVLDKHFSVPNKINDQYFGKKRITDICKYEKLIFEFPRKRNTDYKTLAVRKTFSDNSAVLEYPQEFGYSDDCYLEESNYYPIHDFLSYCKTNNLKFEFDNEGKRIVRWFKKLFIEEFGLDIEFSLFFKSRIMKYTKEYEYFYTLFKNSKLKEVFIPSAYWSAGIVSAAKNCGIVVSDIQYALISKYHPSFAFPVSARAYGSDRVYLWSKYWNIKEVPYNKSFVLETNYLKEKLMNFGELNNLSVKYDIAFIGQSRIGRKLFNIALDYAKLNKDKNIVFCPHPDEMVELYARYQEINGLDNLNISEKFQDTLEAILLSKNIVGVYSTSLIEAAALNKKVFSIKLSGHEVLEREVEKGYICYIDDINDLNNKILSNFVSNNPDVSNLYDNEFIKMEIEA